MTKTLKKPIQLLLITLTLAWSAAASSSTTEWWDPGMTYDGSYDNSMYYWTDDDGIPTPASNKNSLADVVCDDAWRSLKYLGAYTGKFVIWKHDSETWDPLSTIDIPSRFTECEVDGGIHGNGDPNNLWPESGPTAWSATRSNVSFDNIEPVTIWSGNYLNWYSAFGEMIAVNESDELDSNSVRLPSGNTGLLRTGRGGERWRIDSRTALYVGRDAAPVSMVDFRAALAEANFGLKSRRMPSGIVLSHQLGPRLPRRQRTRTGTP